MLQLNSFSPTLLNCRIILELLVLNGNRLKKYFIVKKFHKDNFYNSLGTVSDVIISASLASSKIFNDVDMNLSHSTE